MAYNEDVNINLNILAGALGGITAISAGMSALTSTFGQFGTTAAESFGSLDGILVSATALIGTFTVQAANAAGEFEQGMKIVQAVSGQTGSAISQLGEQANKLSVEYRTAIGDITEGLQTLGRAGLNSADSQLEVLESGLQTAKLEGRNLNSVLEELIQNTALLGGNLDSLDFGGQSEYVNSLMVGTSMSAPIDTHDISQTLQYVGGTAAAAGANLEDKEKLEDLMGTIAAFAQKGVTGSMAGTALRAFLTKPASQDKSVTEGLSSIGLSPDDLWEEDGQKMKNVSDQIALIHKQMERLNLSTMDQLEIWGKIVGPKMGQQMMKLDEDKIKTLTKDIQDASSAEELATSTLSTYNQKINEMGQLSDVVFRGIGSKFIMFFNPVIEIINKFLELLSNPYINTAVFMGVFALISHGIQKAYSMVTTLYHQIREALSGTGQGIQGITPSMNQATNSAARFKNEIYAIIDATNTMNSNIANTGTLSGAMQAHLVGKKAATGFLRGYEGEKTLPVNVVGVSDKYTQYFAKPQMGPEHYEAYRLMNDDVFEEGVREGLSKAEYNALPYQDKKFFEPHADNKDLYIPRGGGGYGVISIDDFNRLTDQTKELFYGHRVEGTSEGFRGLSKKERDTFFRPVDEMIVNKDDAFQYLKTSDYHSLSKEDKKNFYSQDFRGTARFGTAEQMRKEIIESAENLQMWNKDTKEWAALSKEEKEIRLDAEREWRKAKAGEMIDSAKSAGQDAFGREMFGYATLEKIPDKETLLEKLSREGAEKSGAMSAAQAKQLQQEVDAAYTQALGRGGRLQRAGLDKLGSYANQISDGAKRIGNSIKTVHNAILQGGGSLRRGFSNLQQSINLESGGIRGALRKLWTSITSEEGGIRRSIARFQRAISIDGIVDGLKNRFAIFAGQLGMSSSRLQALESTASGVMQEVMDGGTKIATVNELITQCAEKVGVSEQQFVQLIRSSEALGAKFNELATKKTGASGDDIGKAMGNVSKQGGRLSGAFGKLVGLAGGPVSLALMGLTLAIQIAQQAFQDWQKRMQEATTELKESQSKIKDAEEGIKEAFKNENEDASEAELDAAVTAQYSSLYDYNQGDKNLNDLAETNVDGMEEGVEGLSITQEENISAVQENTQALIEATAEYRAASDKVNAELTDDWFGMNSVSSNLTDQLGKWQEQLTKKDNDYNTPWYLNSNRETADGILKNNGPVLTGSQKDDKYEGSKEFAGIFSADIFRFGVEGGLHQFFGSDYDTIIGLMESMDKKIGLQGESSYGGLQTHAANFAPQARNAQGKITGIDYQKAAAMQTELKNNKPLYQQLGRQMYTYEKAGGFRNTAYNDVLNKKDKKQAQKMNKQELRALQNIRKTLQRIQQLTGTKLTEANILAMAQLQQLADMYQIGIQQVVPGIDATVARVIQNGQTQMGIANESAGSGSGAVSAGQNAGAIAALLGAYLQGKVIEAQYEEDRLSGKLPAGINSLDEYKNMLGREAKDDIQAGRDTPAAQALGRVFNKMGQTAYLTEHGGEPYDAEAVKAAGDRRSASVIEQMRQNHTNTQDALNTMTTPGVLGVYKDKVLAGYGEAVEQANKGGSGSGGGGGGGGGGSADDSGKNTKNRVDLVLCNKKEIPKLNVNLFKKEPNFTVLNKNFKLRDIKINTKDTPKSILDAVKNGIIDTAKRMDPKIIQDEEAVYDPMGATEGTQTPSGTTPTG